MKICRAHIKIGLRLIIGADFKYPPNPQEILQRFNFYNFIKFIQTGDGIKI